MTGGVRKLYLDDEWIMSHFNGSEIAALCREYNAAHGTELDKGVFNHYCKRWLGVQSRGRKYTVEEQKFLRGYYPAHGSKQTAKEFRRRFGREVSADTLKRYCSQWLQCSASELRKQQYEAMRSPIGTLSVNCRGEAMIKTESGWIKATHSQVDVPEGMVAFNLDRDIYNNAPENIGITTNSMFRTLRNNGFWSDNREVTKTGLLCVELERMVNGF